MTEPLHIVLEFARAESAGQPHSFRFAAQPYLVRTPGGGFEASEFPWSGALLADLEALREPAADPELLHRIGGVLREFLAGVGWGAREEAIVAATRAGAAIDITIRSAAAELYALPWELVALKSTGQLLGGIPGLVIRYEWPETSTFPDPVAPASRRGRVLFAWSAAGGAVPAAEHQAGLQAALGADFVVARDVVAHASFAAIAAALERAGRDEPAIDALVILCHGAAVGAAYGLALDGGGVADSVVVDAGRVQQLIAPHAGALRLVVLAACNSGAVGEPGNHLGSIAQMIHRAGLRAVVASRFPLSTAGSAVFCGALFAGLARAGNDLERAFLAGREALVRDPGQLDWASVQLYARAADGGSTLPLTRPAAVVAAAGTAAPRRSWAALAGAIGAAVLVLAGVVYGLWPAERGEGAIAVKEPVGPAAVVDAEVTRVEPTTKAGATQVEGVTKAEATKVEGTTKAEATKPEGTKSPQAKPDGAVVKPVGVERPGVKPPAGTPVACPEEVRGYFVGNLQSLGVHPELKINVAAGGGVTYLVSGDDKSFADKAAVKYPTLSARLTRDHAAALPCTLRLKRG